MKTITVLALEKSQGEISALLCYVVAANEPLTMQRYTREALIAELQAGASDVEHVEAYTALHKQVEVRTREGADAYLSTDHNHDTRDNLGNLPLASELRSFVDGEPVG